MTGISTTPLPPGTVLAVLRAAGFEVASDSDKVKQEIRCPLHEDKYASAFVDRKRNVFYCSVCTPDGGWPAKRLADEFHLDWSRILVEVGVRSAGIGPLAAPPTIRVRPPTPPEVPEFGAAEAQAAWRVFEACARDDSRFELDHRALKYLQRRGLLSAWDEGVVGIVPDDSSLPGTTTTWRGRGYVVAAPLYDARGELCNVQARSIVDQKPKSIFPRGSCAKGAVFATVSGQRVLAGQDASSSVVILAEGMTDYLALALTTSAPVLSAPGTGAFADAVGAWARGRTVLLAADLDDAGQAALEPAAKRLYGAGARQVVRLVWPGEGKDACDVIAGLGLDALREFLDREVAAHV